MIYAYDYAVMTKAIADDNAGLLQYGTRTSVDDSTVIAKVPVGVIIEGATMMALSPLFEYIKDNPTLWSDPSL